MGLALAATLGMWCGTAAAEPSLVAAAGAALQVGGGGSAQADRSVATALEVGLALDLGERLRLSLSGAFLPDVADPDRVDRGLWRFGPALRLALAGPTRRSGPWVALGGGMGATTEEARPYARADLGWSIGNAAQLGLVVSAVRDLDSLERGATFVVAALRFDGVVPGPWMRATPAVAAAAPSPSLAEGPEELPAGTPLDPEIVRSRVRENRDDVETCVALANRHGEPAPPRVDLALVILPGGRVHEARVEGGGDDLSRCIETRARTWTFPTAQGTTRFSAPFVLR